MHQLTGLDTSFLRLETRSTYGHVSGLTIYDPSTTQTGELTLEDFKRLLSSRLHLLPPFRWRLAEVPFKLDDPYWIEAPEFDLDFHLREIALAPPGDDHQLAEQVARIAARPLDRSRPLWELYLIHGLQGGRTGVLTKMHHAAIDGVSGAEIMGILLDVTPQPREVPPPDGDWKPERPPHDVEMLGRGVAGALTRPVKMLRMAPRTLPSLADVPGMGNVPGVDTLSRASARIARLGSGGDGRLLERQQLTAPRTSLNGPISPHRRFSFGSVSLADVKAVKDAFGLTVNDVVMSMCTDALRTWLIDHAELPDDPLLAMVPVSVRSEDRQGAFGNQVSIMVVPLPTNEPDRRRRLSLMQDAMRAAKERHRATPATLMQDFAEFIPPAIAARATRVITGITAAGRFSPLFNVVISNVPGPQFPLYSAGARMLGNYPVSAITDGVGLNMTVMSYDGKLDFGLVACREMVPDIWALMGHVQTSLEELKELAGESTAAQSAAAGNGKPKAPRAKAAAGAKGKAAKKRGRPASA
jgi:WS/DGAT/MGAT family acyltransferase